VTIAVTGSLRTGVWQAHRDRVPAGRLLLVERPDGRRYLVPREADRASLEALLAVALPDLADTELRIEVGDDDGHSDPCATHGFVVERREHHLSLSTGGAADLAAATPVPDDVEVLPVDAVPVTDLAALDEELRQDVPGTDGWRSDPAALRAELDDAATDPATYLVARDVAVDRCVGLVRVWWNPGGPRLGLVGVVRTHRRRGLALALTARVLAVVAERNLPGVATEVDARNTASLALCERFSPVRTGDSLTFLRQPRPYGHPSCHGCS
jgi:RimJ/RimL family protein N-acetyltransferase